ncbi:uncharacterized protein LOC105782867 [Gossypium raimondii]|uniref:RING-type domain-containing protein n=2 Tax=Gossypium raimondii TaxID=29730 RepID=A0A0D2W9R8_GOSRA|nr:uncharacterized protein LOC105782867 [Gossypium raimondii]XP_012463374.1 uncharacterized protein LOC105782867 [Gossypium raimondii]KJB83815.1 hypothetical protein B456_013G266000 [Gossypium raimondii]KJB83816.1 hypothetical protein B456_013G266000 [Gossypium raimondii]
MSDAGERTCPLCAEEMDLTDQQLKPCKCGYEICVWCWHHIMDMAEKDKTEGRCPACRSAYDKEKIVGMEANCERLVAEINSGRKTKSQKAKTKSSEGRKQLSNVRVIQRNLVYIVGLPLNLADEDLLQRREYFGQYGKVLKVSMSRTAAGTIQQFPNNTCSVYITYSKEEEAICCIQSVHVFVLDGKPLKACFGTTKYCHAWLRNMPCSNPDCLYLHEIGSQEDSFTKDEIISAYTRVQQITGTTNNMQRRVGTTLPPPVDDYYPNSSASTAKPISKNAPNNMVLSSQKDSPSNGSTGRSIGLPAGASWGMRALNQPQSASLTCSNGLSKQKSDTVSSTLPFLSAVMNTNRAFALHDDAKKNPSEEIDVMYLKGKPDSLEQNTVLDSRTTAPEKPSSPDGVPTSKSLSSQISYPPVSSYNDPSTYTQSTVTSSIFDHGGKSFISSSEKGRSMSSTDGEIQSLCSDVASLTLDRNVANGHLNVVRPSSSASNHGSNSSSSSQGLQQCCSEHYREPLSSTSPGRSATSPERVSVSKEQSDWRIVTQTQAVASSSSEIEEDILSFDNQRLKDPEVISRSNYMPNSPISLHLSNLSRSHSFQNGDACGAVSSNADTFFVDNQASAGLHLHGSSVSSLSNGYPQKYISSSIGSGITTEGNLLVSNQEKGKQMGRFLGNAKSNTSKDTGENSIISNILSLDFDTWDESLTSPRNLAKLLDGTDQQQPNSLKLSSSGKALNSSQSRFSFARQEDSSYHPFGVESSSSVFGQMTQNHISSQVFAESRDLYLNAFGISNGFSPSSFDEYEKFTGSPSLFSSNKLSVSRAQVSAPPGFSVPSRAPPPGFSSHERVDHSFDTPGNHLMDSSSLLRNSYLAPVSSGFGGAEDVEFMDPAILAVGKGRHQGGLNNSGLDIRSNFPPQLSPYENEARVQLLMQRSLSPHQNLRHDVGDSFSSLNDSYGLSSRLMGQSQVNNISPYAQLPLQQSRNLHMSNGLHWDGWNEVQGGNSAGIAELLRNERLGFNKFYSGYEDSKYMMGDLYNRTFGM